MCIFTGCKKASFYGYKGGKREYCKTHKLDDMINIKFNICISEGCSKIASCNFRKEKKKLYCKDHKLTGLLIY